MKALLLILACFLSSPAKADARSYDAEELEALLAPVALQPDDVLWNILEASTTPQDVLDAAAGRPAVTPAVGALAPYPDLLARMAESPRWLMDLGSAYIGQRNDVLAAVQALRQRAHANGYLQSDPMRVVQQHGPVIAVLPAVPHYYSVRYYNPVVVYGAAWRPRHPHVHWRPWVSRPVVEHPLTIHAHTPSHRHPGKVERHGAPSPAVRMQREQASRYREYHRVPESQRQPIVQQRHFEQRQFGAASHPRRHP